VESTSLILKEFEIPDTNLHFFVGLTQVKITVDKLIDFRKKESEENELKILFGLTNNVQKKFKSSIIQFIKDYYLLNEDHIFTACYYVEKAFRHKKNISNKKNIELLLYLAANRQISKSIDGFGIDISDLNKQKLTLCIVSTQNNLNKIYEELSNILFIEEINLTINNQTNAKINLIKKYFEFSEDQINIVLKSYGIISNNAEFNSSSKTLAIYDLICEKMALLYVEKGKKL
jgi:tRNA threonylcarbamoyladenosine modification (KEOPS) complex Cgi121 subunit